jgi:hypothetical protein
MPSKLDPHVALIESWLAAEPQLTAIAIGLRVVAAGFVLANPETRRCGRAPLRPMRMFEKFDVGVFECHAASWWARR